MLSVWHYILYCPGYYLHKRMLAYRAIEQRTVGAAGFNTRVGVYKKLNTPLAEFLVQQLVNMRNTVVHFL